MSTAQPARSGTLAGISATIRARTSSGRDGRDTGPDAQPASTASATASVDARRAMGIGRG
jgi:hypothetical protein